MRSNPRSVPAWRASLGWLCALVTAATLVWMWHYHKWTAADWRLPTDYGGDALETLTRIKAASEGDTWPLLPQVISRLGAPFGAHWNAYPTPDKLIMLALGGLSRFVGVFAAGNAGMLLAQLSAAVSFYWAARQLRARREWSFAGALLFAHTYSAFHRGLAHFSLIFTWTIPLGLVAVWIVAQSRRMRWGGREMWICFAAAVALGAHNPYNLYFWIGLMGWAGLTQWCGPRRRANLQIGAAALALSMVAFFAMQAEFWLHQEHPDMLPLLARNYAGTERYALKPVEMFIPPYFHRWPWLASFGYKYGRLAEWRGEVFLPYLGLAGIVAFVWLAALSVRALLRRKPVPGPALAVGWLIALATIGGINNVLAFYGGIQMFRATNRAGVYISAIVLCFLVVRLSRKTMTWPRWLAAVCAVVIAGIGILDQVPREDTAAERAQVAAVVRSDGALWDRLEAALPAGSMVFQLPALGFPEVLAPAKMGDYDLFRPYLNTRDLRFTYGAGKMRARSRWARDLSSYRPGNAAKLLESYGFGAIYVDRDGYQDHGKALLGRLAAAGYTRTMTSQTGNQTVIFLHPAPTPLRPLAQGFTCGQGWHTLPENGVRWDYSNGLLAYYNPYSKPLDVTVSLTLTAEKPCRVTLKGESGSPLGKVTLARGDGTLLVPRVMLQPGINRFFLAANASAQRFEGQGSELRLVGLRQSLVVPLDAPIAALTQFAY